MLNQTNVLKINESKDIFKNSELTISETILDLFKLFNFKSLCFKNNMTKNKGYSIHEILTVLILFPFMAIHTIRAFHLSKFNSLTEAKKNTFFRFKNNENYNWRKLLYLFNNRFKVLVKRSENLQTETNIATPKCIIIDDSTISKEGRKIEFIGKVHDHVLNIFKLGFKLLLVGFWDGKSLIPLDFSYHSEKGKNKKRPFSLSIRQLKQRFSKQRSKKSIGYKRSKELFVDKITNGISMIKRAVKHGFIPDYVLTDSWFSSFKFIQVVRRLKKGIVHFLGMVKMDNRHYEYQGQTYNAKELKKKFKPKMKRAKKLNAYYIELIVNYGEIGTVKLFFIRFSKRSKWRLLLTTNVQLNFQQMIKIYNIRWSIEVLFKECKQLLNLGKCQSTDFDAQIADVTVTFILYTMLSFHKRIHCYTTLGVLFKKYCDNFNETTIVDKLWHLFLTLQLAVSEILGIDYDEIMKILFQIPELKNSMKSLAELFLKDDSLENYKIAA